jgi:hypothetical protein
MQILHRTSRRSLLPLAMALTPPETQHKAPAESPWLEHPTRSGLRDRLQLAYDCWTLLELPNGTSRRPLYLPRGIEEAETCYIKRLEAARPNGFYRDALRTYAGMLSRLALQELPDSLTHVATDVDGQGTDLGVFLFLANLLTLRDGGCLILQLPPRFASGNAAVPVGEPEKMPQRFDLPALWYSVDGTAFGEGDLPHLGLAHQYLNHYRCRSDYEDLLSRTALPVGVRTGLVDAYGFRRSDGALPLAAGALHLLLHGPT